MRRLLAVFLAFSGLVLALPATAIEAQIAPDVPAGTLELADDSANLNGGFRTYIVQFKLKSGIAYDGGVAGYAATAPTPSASYDPRSSAVQMYTQHLINSHDRMLKKMNARDRKLYSYSHTLNGFAARLTSREVEQLRGDKDVLAVWEDYATDLNTNNSPDFLGLHDRREGLHRRQWLKGENVIVGVLDSGVTPNHPSFSDKREFPLPAFCENASGFLERICDHLRNLRQRVVYDAPPADWGGTCQVGEGWIEDDCNRKLIGARFYVDGFLAGRGSVVEDEFLSPRDSDGHGSHTASTAAGNSAVKATFNGTPLAFIEGMAPRARVAAYKVCWLSPGATTSSCFFSDSAAATDQAVADGVDVLNFSIGTAASFTDPQDIAFLNATAAGVFVARSGGNSGPGFGSINAGAPWVTSVAASTLSGTGFALAATINSPAAVAGDVTALEGAITQPLAESGDITDDLVAADPLDACAPLLNDIDGHIALIARGTCAFTTKVENAVNAGASAVFMFSDSRPKTVMGGTPSDLTLSIPGVMVDNAVGLALVDQIDLGETVNVSLSANSFTTEELQGNIMAGFSSRGPYLTESDWTAPNITAPGVRILAAYSPDQSDGSAGDSFSYLQGTSMSSPHIAGLGALVVQAHPDWSPAQIKSALMTTARQDVVKEDGVTPADPFDFGAGHVDPNGAIDPGLTYDVGLLDYLAASCGTADPIVDGETCDLLDALHFPLDPADLNLPSIGIGELPGAQVVTRTVTAVDGFKRFSWRNRHGSHGKKGKRRTYRVSVDAPEGFRVDVKPKRIRLAPGETASYDVTITNETAPPGEWFHGSLTWSDNKGHDVRSPISVNAVALIAPAELSSTGTDGSLDFDVTFGFSGEYTAGTHGLNEAAGFFIAEVEQDPDQSFSFNEPGLGIGFFDEIPDGLAHVRWSLFNEYTSGNDDLDMYLFYCPAFLCTLMDSSGNADSNEEVNIILPPTDGDPTVPDPYILFIHGFSTEGGLPAEAIVFHWQTGLDDDAGNMVVTAPGSATIGNTENINVTWSGLSEGPASRQLGAVSHSDANGLQALTLININNDPDGTICDFGLCAPPPP